MTSGPTERMPSTAPADTRAETRHAPERSRYELLEDGEVVAHADYRRSGDVLVMHHTYTEPAWRGRGLGDRVVRAALDDVRAAGLGIHPTCWFVGAFVDAHPEYRDLVRA